MDGPESKTLKILKKSILALIPEDFHESMRSLKFFTNAREA
jgi:hypothetical protein